MASKWVWHVSWSWREEEEVPISYVAASGFSRPRNKYSPKNKKQKNKVKLKLKKKNIPLDIYTFVRGWNRCTIGSVIDLGRTSTVRPPLPILSRPKAHVPRESSASPSVTTIRDDTTPCWILKDSARDVSMISEITRRPSPPKRGPESSGKRAVRVSPKRRAVESIPANVSTSTSPFISKTASAANDLHTWITSGSYLSAGNIKKKRILN